MSILTKHPKKVRDAMRYQKLTGYYLIINTRSGLPQYFAEFIYHNDECLGKLVDAESDRSPAGIYDKETSLYYIGQTAIYNTLSGEVVDNYILIPVIGHPISSPSTASK